MKDRVRKGWVRIQVRGTIRGRVKVRVGLRWGRPRLPAEVIRSSPSKLSLLASWLFAISSLQCASRGSECRGLAQHRVSIESA